jgi:uncharacterized protein YceK
MKFLWFGGVLFGLLCSMMSCMTVWTVYDAEEQEPLFYSGVRRSVDIMGSGNSGVLGMVMSGGNPAGLFYAQVLAVVDFPLSAVADTVLLPYTIPQSVVVHSQIKAEKERVELFQRVKEGSFSSSEFQSFYEASKKNETIRDGLLENPKTPSEILEQIYEEQGKEIKVCIQMACHPQSSSRLLERIDPELDGSLPKLLAKHPQSSSKLLAGLAQKYDQDIELQRYIAFHRETSEETLSQFLKKYYDPQQEEYPYDVDLVLESIAAHRNATEEMRFLFFRILHFILR